MIVLTLCTLIDAGDTHRITVWINSGSNLSHIKHFAHSYFFHHTKRQLNFFKFIPMYKLDTLVSKKSNALK